MRQSNSMCPNKLVLLDRVDLSALQVVKLKRLFKMIANETRLLILHALIRSGELCVNDIARALIMKPQAISNQLQRMTDKGILGSRRDGNSIYYKITDPCVPEILDRALCLIEMPNKNMKSGAVVRQKR
ncbi:metalloregulator ArsR/SmtB family transcription factor [bacterium]|nr:metalloregulator ArsR/SmtB family transcription factor [bacterium]